MNSGNQLFRQHWLVEEVIRSGFNPAQLIRTVGESRDQHKGNQPRCRIFLEAAAKFISRLSRHHYVRQDQVGSLAADLGLSLISIFRSYHLIAAHSQQLTHQPGNAWLIVNH